MRTEKGKRERDGDTTVKKQHFPVSSELVLIFNIDDDTFDISRARNNIPM